MNKSILKIFGFVIILILKLKGSEKGIVIYILTKAGYECSR